MLCYSTTTAQASPVAPLCVADDLFTTICSLLLINRVLLCCCLDGKVGGNFRGLLWLVLVFFVAPFYGAYWGNDCFLGRNTDMLPALMFSLFSCKLSAQGNRGNSSTWVWHDFFGALLAMLLEEHFQVRAKLALPRQAFPCLAQSQETVNISSCHGVVNSLFCVCFSIYHHSPHLLCSAFTPRLVLHLMPQSFIPAAQKFVSPLISILCSAAILPKLFLGGWYNHPRPF